MKFLWMGLLWSLLLVVPLPLRAQPADPYQTTLKNGLKLIVKRHAAQPIVSVTCLYEVGGIDDPAGYEQLSHLSEHLLAVQTHHHEKPSLHLNAQGGATSAWTTEDQMSFHTVIPSEKLEHALWVESDRMAYALHSIDGALLAQEREVVRREWHERQNVTKNEIFDDIRHRFFANSELFEHMWRPQEELDRISLDDVRWFVQGTIRPDNATLVIFGDVDPEQTASLVRKYFDTVQRPAAPRVGYPRPVKFPKPRVITRDESVSWPWNRVSMLWLVDAPDRPTRAALDVLAFNLSERARGLLVPLSFYSSAHFREHRWGTLFSVDAIPVESRNFPELVNRIDAELDRLAKEPSLLRVTERERRHWLSELIACRDDVACSAYCFLRELREGPDSSLAAQISWFRAVDDEVLRRALKLLLPPHPRVVMTPAVMGVRLPRRDMMQRSAP